MLQDTARWHGWQAVHVVGTEEGFRTHGLVDKLRALRRFARKWSDDTILVFVDAYDVVINNEPFVLESAFLASGKRVLLAGPVKWAAARIRSLPCVWGPIVIGIGRLLSSLLLLPHGQTLPIGQGKTRNKSTDASG